VAGCNDVKMRRPVLARALVSGMVIRRRPFSPSSSTSSPSSSAIVAAFTSHATPPSTFLSHTQQKWLHRTQRRHGPASKMNSPDGAPASEVRAEVDHQRVSLEASEVCCSLVVESGWQTMRCSTVCVLLRQGTCRISGLMYEHGMLTRYS
jgi:hypothetical protein